jgi:hypothetical protein
MTHARLCCLAVLVTAFSSPALLSCQQRPSQPKPAEYGGRWWLSVSSLEQRGFINGSFDCTTWKLGDRRGARDTAEEVQKFANGFYEDPSHWPVPVSRIVEMYDSRHTSSPKQISGAEVWNEPHGYWDGLWWKGAGYPNTLEQRGYVEGYLNCYRFKTNAPTKTFSKSPKEYVVQITDWYRRSGREDAKIADVLFSLSDQEHHTSSESK